MRPTIRTPLLAALLLASGACASTPHPDDDLHPEVAAARNGRVELTNDGHQDMVLYVVRDAERYRLGYVSRMQTANFRLPRAGDRASYQMSLIVEPVGGGRSFATAPVVWHPGQTMLARVGRSSTSHTFDVVLR
ncbi:MAG TPA: hypothetical protein VFY65_02685 [Longimicrobium sp.]|nr:hypothetical protein [Longimicrobium sp.]